MARIPQDELDRLKREVSIAELAEAQGVKLRRNGKTATGLCPLHDDHDPSLHIDLEKNLWRCFGCDQGGTVIDWVMKEHGVSFRHAVEILREHLGTSPVVNGETAPGLPLACPLDLEANDDTLRNQVVEYYQRALPGNPSALAFLERRGIALQDAINTFKLGFADRTLGLRLPNRQLKAGQQIRSQLQEIGIIRDTGHEAFRGSVVFPVIDGTGAVTEIYGRKITDDVRPGTPLHLYLPGPHRGVWNIAAFRDSREIILCESIIDALTFWCAGFQNVTSSYGTNGFTRDHLEAMKAYGTKKVLIAYDRDEAGDPAAKKLAKQLGAEGIGCYRVLFPREMDANEYALRVTPPSRSLGVLLGSAEWMSGPMNDRGTVAAPSSAPASPAPAPPPEGASSLAAKQSQLAPAPAASREAPPATPPPAPAPVDDIPAEVSENEVLIRLEDLRWRVRGLTRNTSIEQLKVNLMVTREDDDSLFHVDNLDLYSSRQRDSYIRKATSELGCKERQIKDHIGKVFRKLEQLQHERINEALKPKETTVQLSAAERREAMALLEDPKLLDLIVADLERCGVIGEETNKLVAYLAATSRKLEEPLAVLIQSSSAAGKSALMNGVLDTMPEEERVQYSAMTGQSLYYLGETNLKHKILAIAEEEGAEKASYSLKLLQSEGELSIASAGKDPATGMLKTFEYHVEGPVAILLTTTAIDIDEELMNRCVMLTVDEGREQTQAIHRLQRERRTLEGLKLRKQRSRILALHRNVQRLLEPLAVVNPYAHRLTFLDTKTRTRRDHEKYLTLIEAVALLHQHQRQHGSFSQDGEPVQYLEVTLEDIEIANRLATEVLGRTLDELPPQTRRLLLLIDGMVTEACKRLGKERVDYRFSRREAREYSGWGSSQLAVHLKRLEEMEYLVVHQGRRGKQIVYELLYEGQGKEGEPFVLKLIDVEKLRGKQRSARYEGNLPGSENDLPESEGNLPGSFRPHSGPIPGGFRDGEDATEQSVSGRNQASRPRNAHKGSKKQPPSYVRQDRTSSTPIAAKASGDDR